MNTAELFAHARRHSRFLARCLDSNTLDLNLLADWTARQLSEDDFRNFAGWQALRETKTKPVWRGSSGYCGGTSSPKSLSAT